MKSRRPVGRLRTNSRPRRGLTDRGRTGSGHHPPRRYAAALADQVTDDDVSARTVKNLQLLTERAVDYGVLAPGVDGADIKALIIALRGVVSMTDDGDDTTWRRFLRLHLAGLRVRI